MGFCRRCGDIVSSGTKCVCGGLVKESTVKGLFESAGTDKWGQRYLAKSISNSSNILNNTSSSNVPEPKPTLAFTSTSSGGAPRTPLSPHFLSSKSESSELFHFGSILSPSDHWQCVSCEAEFAQEDVVYPHPDAKHNHDLNDVYFCRQCFADRFSKGNCKKCKCAVLSDAPFIKHADKVWHNQCYTCSYCDNNQSIIIDFGGNPSCESCFDQEAYKHRGIPPSPHLAQTGFAFNEPPRTRLQPAPTKWGRSTIHVAEKNTASTSTQINGDVTGKNDHRRELNTAWRLQTERDNSPLVAAFDELGHKFGKVGLSSQSSSPKKEAAKSPWTAKRLTTTAPATTPDQENATLNVTSNDVSPAKTSKANVSRLSNSRQPNQTDFASTCSKCLSAIGSQDYVRVSSTGELLHRDCFKCAGCRQLLEGGKHVDAEGTIWHKECAPPPKRIKTLVASLKGDAEKLSDATCAQNQEAGSRSDDSESDICGTCRIPIVTGYTSLSFQRMSRQSTVMVKDVVAPSSVDCDCAPMPRLTFLQGVVCGQLSFLVVAILFLKYFVFEDSRKDDPARLQTNPSRKKRTKRPRKSSVSVDSTAPLILAALEYDIASHAPETLDWLNVLIAQALSGYRSSIVTSTVGLGQGGAKGLLEQILNKESTEETNSKPGMISLDYIEVTDVAVGDKYPILSDARVRPSGEDGSVRVEIDVDFTDHVSLSVSTSLLANFPRPRFAVLPVSLGLTLERFSGTLTVELPTPAQRIHHDLRQGAKANADATSTEGLPAPSIHLSLHPDFTLDISTASLLGSRAKLQDVPKIEQLILARIRGYIQDRVVWPGRVQIALPAVHPSSQHHHHHHHHHKHPYPYQDRQQQGLGSGETDGLDGALYLANDVDHWVERRGEGGRGRDDSVSALSPRSIAPTDLLRDSSRRSSSTTNTSAAMSPVSTTPPSGSSSSSATPPSVDLDAPGGPSVTLHPKVKPPTVIASSPSKSRKGAMPLPSPSESVPGFYRPSPPLETHHQSSRSFERHLSPPISSSRHPPPLSRGGGRGKWVDPTLAAKSSVGPLRQQGSGVTAARLAEMSRLHEHQQDNDKTVDVGGLRYRYGGRGMAGVGVGVEVASSVGSRSRR
ncbi:hypothetical protein OIO90_005397 [Microbotryomycetes sp. JL221]|nr:hypothetical protein OIO90_005397 [Microbotryomycetes sp. JL221]